MDALIGYTGFVGSNILRQRSFENLYNSKNIKKIAGKVYDLLVCSAAPAEKWKANQNPVQDWETVQELMGFIGRFTAKQMVLISTVDVYPLPMDNDEDTIIDVSRCHPYGKHRLLLEQFVQERFNTLTVRLPGLFGKGLKKNIIYDFLHNNSLGQIHVDAVYQFYYLDHIWKDIEVALSHGLKLVNFATKPISVKDIAERLFQINFENRPHSYPALYNIKSKHASLFGGEDGYLYNKAQVLQDLEDYVELEGWRKR